MQIPESSLMRFLETVYVPAKLDLSVGQVEQLKVVVRQLDYHAHYPDIGKLTDEMVGGFLRACLQHGLSPNTVNSKRAKILALWRLAWKKHLVPDLPRDVPRCRVPRKIPVAWTSGELSRLAAHASTLPGMVGELPANWFWRSMILITWESGLRVGAVRKLLVEDFHAHGPALLVRAETQKTTLGQCLPLSLPLATALAKHLYAPQRKLIFPWPHCERWFFSKFRKIVEAAGLYASLNGHDLFYKIRRSNLSYIARNGSLEMARQQAGHTSAATTLRHYIDPRIANTQRAIDVLPNIEIR